MTRIGIALACALALACSTGGPPSVPTSEYDRTFDFRAGDGRLDPTLLDVNRDGKPDHVLVCKYELTRNEGHTRGKCEKKYTVTMAITRYGSNGNGQLRGSPWHWCSSQGPRGYPLRGGAAVWIDWTSSDWKICVFDDIVRCAP